MLSFLKIVGALLNELHKNSSGTASKSHQVVECRANLCVTEGLVDRFIDNDDAGNTRDCVNRRGGPTVELHIKVLIHLAVEGSASNPSPDAADAIFCWPPS